MKVTVRFFASIREALGAGETMELPQALSVGQLRDLLIQRDAVHAAALARGRALRAALNHQMCGDDVSVTADAEVAYFPPVTGG